VKVVGHRGRGSPNGIMESLNNYGPRPEAFKSKVWGNTCTVTVRAFFLSKSSNHPRGVQLQLGPVADRGSVA
jgi:hypothetical protein